MCIRDRGKGFYKLPKAGTEFTSSELIAHWKKLVEKYPCLLYTSRCV